MKTRKLLVLCLAITLAISTLCGCSGGENRDVGLSSEKGIELTGTMPNGGKSGGDLSLFRTANFHIIIDNATWLKKSNILLVRYVITNNNSSEKEPFGIGICEASVYQNGAEYEVDYL